MADAPQSDFRGSMMEFRRWVIAAFVLAIVGSCLERIGTWFWSTSPWIFNAFMVVIWVGFTAIEGWIQFSGVVRRVCWPIAGVLTVGCLLSLKPSALFSAFVLFLVPACVEFLTARGVRRRPWVWLIATPLLYGTLGFWVHLAAVGTRRLMTLIQRSFNLPATMDSGLAEYAACLVVILIFRAVVGSFIASRRPMESAPSETC